MADSCRQKDHKVELRTEHTKLRMCFVPFLSSAVNNDVHVVTSTLRNVGSSKVRRSRPNEFEMSKNGLGACLDEMVVALCGHLLANESRCFPVAECPCNGCTLRFALSQ
jgi:hypothetical protein